MNSTFDITKGAEDAFTEIADGEDTTSDCGFEVVSEVFFKLSGGMSGGKRFSEGVVAHLAEFAQFFAANGDKLLFGRLLGWR